jgi:hypothetical protein
LRGSTMPAGRVFSLQATRLVSSTRRPVGLEATPESREPTTWPGSCGSGAPQPDWSRAIRYLYHNERHLIGLLTICSSRPLPGSAPAWVKAPRCPTHRLRGGDDGLPVYRSSAVLGASEDISLLLPPRSNSGRAWYTGSAGSGHLRRPGDFHHRDLYGRRFVLLACRGQWRGVDLGRGARNASPWRTALDVCISLRCGAGRC